MFSYDIDKNVRVQLETYKCRVILTFEDDEQIVQYKLTSEDCDRLSKALGYYGLCASMDAGRH